MKQSVIISILLACGLAVSASAGVEQTVNDLLPKLAAANVQERFAPQMELQALALKAGRPGAEAERLALAQVLAAKAGDEAVPQPARVWLVRQLEYIGAGESVSVLTALLKGPDAELRECARRALEKNSAPAATESLRAALKQEGDSVWKIGLTQSLGQRRDAASVPLISPELSNPELAFAAAVALAKIGNEDAVKALWAACEQKNAVAAPALVAAAKGLAAKGELAKAAAIYGRLRSTCPEPALRAAALSGLARTEPGSAKSLIGEGLASNEPLLQTAALAAAREIYGKEVSAVIAPLLPTLSASAKVLVLPALDAAAEKAVSAATADSNEAVRLAAFERLGQIGTVQSVPALLAAATEAASGPQKAAATALARIKGEEVDVALTRLAGQGSAGSRVVAISILAERNAQAALPAFLKYASESDRAVSRAACAALGKVGTEKELGELVRLTLAGKTPEAQEALQAVASRAQDKSAAAKQLLAQAQKAEPTQLASIFDIFAMLGGPDALEAVAKYAHGNDQEVKKAAIRSLANWSDFAAAQPLLAIAATPNAPRIENVLALQGVARLVKAAEKEPATARLEAVRAGMKAAQREEEKKQLLSALASVTDPKAAEALQGYLQDPALKTEAGQAGVTLAQSLAKPNKAAARKLAQAIKAANLSPDLNRKANALLTR